MIAMRKRLALMLAASALLAGALAPAPARANWTTYRGDPGRSGVDSSSMGSLPFAAAWSSQNLGGEVYWQPVVDNGLVIVATEADTIYALDERTGQLVWHARAGTPVLSGQLPCGDISSTVGITSTPVIVATTGQVFVVADTSDGSNSSSIQHRLDGFNVADGSSVPGLPVAVDPPESTPTAQLQRAALALSGGRVIVGFGGNDGDCGNYHGWLVGVPETGGPLSAFEVESQSGANGGAIWGAGSGGRLGGSVWAASGNGFGSGFGNQESVLKLDANLTLLDHWAPSNWQALDSSDADLGSSDPLLLPGASRSRSESSALATCCRRRAWAARAQVRPIRDRYAVRRATRASEAPRTRAA